MIINFITYQISAQKDLYTPFKLVQKIPLESYSHYDNGKDMEVALPEIVGLGFLDDKTTYWTNMQGLTTVWDNSNDIYKFNCTINNRLSYNSIYVPILNSIVHNTFGETTKIEINEILKDCASLAVLKGEINVTYRTICISPNSDKIIAVVDSIFYVWKYDGLNWQYTKIETNEHFFEIVFLNNETLLAGCDNGNILMYDADTYKIKKKVKAFDSTTAAIISVSDNKKRFAATEGRDVKIFEEGQTTYTIEPNIELIYALEWLDNDIILVSGEGNAVEIWSVKDIAHRKLLQSFNTIGHSRRGKKEKTINPTGNSYLFVKDSLKIDSLHFHAKLTALGASSNNLICTADETNKVGLYQTIKHFEFLQNISVDRFYYGDDPNHIQEIEIDTTSYSIQIGYEHGYSSLSYKNNSDGVAFATSEPFSEINSQSFNDIVLILHHAHSYFPPHLTWIRSTKTKVGKSKLFKEIQHTLPEGEKETPEDNFPNFKSLKDPSGFDVSHDKKFILQYDSTGLVQILRVDGLKLVFDKIIEQTLKKVFFSSSSNKLYLVSYENKMYSLDFIQNESELKEEEKIDVAFDKVAYNGLNTLAFFNAQEINIYDLTKRKFVDKIINTRKDYSIYKVKFFGEKNSLAWIVNENTVEIQEKGMKKAPITSEGTIKKIAVSKDKKTILLGNSFGEILKLYR